MSAHTAGPWMVTENFDVRTNDAENRFIASVFGRGKEEKEANARLISKAPDLLIACRNLLELLEGNAGAGANFWEQDFRYTVAQGVMAEAEGRTS